MKFLNEIDISGKRVLIRVDFNVPLDKDRNITEDYRIRGALPSLNHILENNGKLIVMSHLGRPKDQPDPEFSLKPVVQRLTELLGREVRMAPDCIGQKILEIVSEMKNGEVILLENLRYHAAEQKNDAAFAKELASLCDIYINDAFAVSHRVNASVCAITEYAPVSGAGFLLKKELEYFKQAMDKPARPLVAIVGGAKVSSKLAALENMLQKVDKVIIGGAMANTFLKAQGFDTGKSKIEEALVDTAGTMMKKASDAGINFYIPVDVVAADAFDENAVTTTVPVQEIPESMMALDIGPATSLLYSEALFDAGTIVWNGPMGVFEMEAFNKGTLSMAKAVAESDALTIIGGGDTDAAVHMSGTSCQMTYISTGGGAFLALLEGKVLPAVAALNKNIV